MDKWKTWGTDRYKFGQDGSVGELPVISRRMCGKCYRNFGTVQDLYEHYRYCGEPGLKDFWDEFYDG